MHLRRALARPILSPLGCATTPLRGSLTQVSPELRGASRIGGRENFATGGERDRHGSRAEGSRKLTPRRAGDGATLTGAGSAAELGGEAAKALDHLADVATARVMVEIGATEPLRLLDVALFGRREPQAVAGELGLGVVRGAL